MLNAKAARVAGEHLLDGTVKRLYVRRQGGVARLTTLCTYAGPPILRKRFSETVADVWYLPR